MSTVNELFTSVLGRDPTASESAYWTSQLGSSPDEGATESFVNTVNTPVLNARANQFIDMLYPTTTPTVLEPPRPVIPDESMFVPPTVQTITGTPIPGYVAPITTPIRGVLTPPPTNLPGGPVQPSGALLSASTYVAPTLSGNATGRDLQLEMAKIYTNNLDPNVIKNTPTTLPKATPITQMVYEGATEDNPYGTGRKISQQIDIGPDFTGLTPDRNYVGGEETLTYRKSVSPLIDAIYDDSGKLMGYESNNNAYFNDNSYVHGSFDTTGKANPVYQTKSAGGELGGMGPLVIGALINTFAPGAGAFVGSSLGVPTAYASMVGNAVINAGLTAAQGGNPLDSLTSSGIGALISAATSQVPGFDALSSTQKAYVNNAVRTALQNGDVTQSLVNTTVSQAMGEITKGGNSGGGSLPGGTQVASNDGSLPTVELSGSPIYAESSSANAVKAPFGFELMPATLSDNRPSGAYYDQFQNAWFMPNEDVTNLSTAIQNGASTGSNGASTSGNSSFTLDGTSKNNTSTAGSNTSTAPLSSDMGNVTVTDKKPVTDMGNVTITDKRPVTDTVTDMGTINVTDTRLPPDVVVPPTTTVTPPLTSVLTPTTTTKTPVKTPTTASNISQITSDAASIGALPTSPSATMLSTGQLEKQSNMLKELTHLYPQLSNVDPRLLSILSGKARSGSHNLGQTSEGGSTPLMSTSAGNAPSAGTPFKASSGNAAGLTSSSGSGALSRAGLNLLSNSSNISGYAKGGLAEHNPEFITGATGHHVKGEGDGQSDSIPAMLADGEYVFDADTVAALGNGSNDAGARILDKMRQNLRKHKRSAPAGKIPPKAKSPLEYMKG